MKPFFSVIVAAYNKADVIGSTLDSLLEQSFTDFEIIVIDDGSNDYSAKLIAEYNSPKITYYYQVNKGVSSARNKGVEISRGSYIVFLDADDQVENDWLFHFHHKIISFEADLVFCDVRTLDAIKNEVRVTSARFPYGNNQQCESGIYLTGAFCIKADLLKKVGCYDSKLRFGENAELSIRMLHLSPKIAFTDQPGLIYNLNQEGSGKNYLNRILDTEYVIQKHKSYFSKNVMTLQLYYQSIAFGYKKLKNKRKAFVFYIKAWLVRITSLKPLLLAIRLVITGK